MKRKLIAAVAAFVLISQCVLVSEALGYIKSINTPHRHQEGACWCGAACAQMVLECDTIAPPPPGRRRATYPTGTNFQIQQELYQSNQDHGNTTTPIGWCTDPDGLEWTLDHNDLQQTYVQYTDADAAWSCRKLAWTIEHYEVPPAILINGGAHWIVVYGLNTSVAPTAHGTYQIHGFRCLDPAFTTGSSGADTYSSYNNFIGDFDTVNTVPADPWDGLRVSVCDPDQVDAELIEPPRPKPGPPISPQAAREAALDAIEEHRLTTLPGYEEALGGATPVDPILVDWPSGQVGRCYSVPFVKWIMLAEKEEARWVVTAVITVHSVTGELMEASYAAEAQASSLDDFHRGLAYPCTPRESCARPGIATPAPSIVDPYGPPAIKINFQPADAVIPFGCLGDFGDPFEDRGNGHSYGWNAPNDEARNRNIHVDQRYDTLNHMQKPSNPHAVWEIGLEKGTYRVVVLCGDPSYQDQWNHIRIEGHSQRDPDPWPGGDSAGADFDVFEAVVDVLDGRLTIEPEDDAQNAKICFVQITPTAPAQSCQSRLVGTDIGDSLPPGRIDGCRDPLCQWTVTAGGADIWGTADQFYYARAWDADMNEPLRVSGDFTAIVRVLGLEPAETVHEWAKAGIMVREHLEPGSPHVMVVRTPRNGVAFQGRQQEGWESWHEPLGGGYEFQDAVWLRLDRIGGLYVASYAIGGAEPPRAWTASIPFDAWLSEELFIGLSTTSHEQRIPVAARYSDFCIGPYAGPPVLRMTRDRAVAIATDFTHLVEVDSVTPRWVGSANRYLTEVSGSDSNGPLLIGIDSITGEVVKFVKQCPYPGRDSDVVNISAQEAIENSRRFLKNNRLEEIPPQFVLNEPELVTSWTMRHWRIDYTHQVDGIEVAPDFVLFMVNADNGHVVVYSKTMHAVTVSTEPRIHEEEAMVKARDVLANDALGAYTDTDLRSATLKILYPNNFFYDLRYRFSERQTLAWVIQFVRDGEPEIDIWIDATTGGLLGGEIYERPVPELYGISDQTPDVTNIWEPALDAMQFDTIHTFLGDTTETAIGQSIQNADYFVFQGHGSSNLSAIVDDYSSGTDGVFLDPSEIPSNNLRYALMSCCKSGVTTSGTDFWEAFINGGADVFHGYAETSNPDYYEQSLVEYLATGYCLYNAHHNAIADSGYSYIVTLKYGPPLYCFNQLYLAPLKVKTAGSVQGSTVTITAAVTNLEYARKSAAANVVAQLIAPAGFTVSGTNPQTTASLPFGNTWTVQWTVQATAGVSGARTFDVIVQSDNLGAAVDDYAKATAANPQYHPITVTLTP